MDDVNDLYEAVMSNYVYSANDVESKFSSITDGKTVLIPADWVDYMHLFDMCTRLCFVDRSRPVPFKRNDLFDMIFGDVAETLADFINLNLEAALDQAINAYVSIGVLKVTGVDTEGRYTYDLGRASDDPMVNEQRENLLVFLEAWRM